MNILFSRHISYKFNSGDTELELFGNISTTLLRSQRIEINTYKNIEQEEAKTIGEALKTNTTITKIDLS